MPLNPKSLYMSVLIIALGATGPISTDLYLPALPEIRAAFGASTFQVQLTLSVFLFGIAFTQLIWGPLSDRFGRRPILLSGLSVYFLASVACALATSIEVLTVARFVQAAGVCAGGVVGRAVVRDIHGPDQAARMFAYVASAVAIAPLLAPLIGGQLTLAWGWESIFAAMACLAIVQVLTISVALPETNQWLQVEALNPRRFAKNYSMLLRNSQYRAYMLASAFNFSGLFAFISGASFVLIEDLGMDVEYFGFAFAFVVLGFMAGAQISVRFTSKIGLSRMIEFGGRLAILSSLLGLGIQLTFEPSVFGIIIPVCLYLMSVGLVMPNATAGAIGPHQNMAGAASALFGFVQMGLAGTVGILVGYVHNGTSVPMFVVIAGCGLLGWFFSRFNFQTDCQ